MGFGKFCILAYQGPPSDKNSVHRLTTEQYEHIKNIIGPIKSIEYKQLTEGNDARPLYSKCTYHSTDSKYYNRVKRYLIKQNIINIGGENNNE